MTVEYIGASLNLMPKTLNIRNPEVITARLTLPGGYENVQVDTSSIQILNGGKYTAPDKVEVTGNGLLIKFDGAAVAGLVSSSGTSDLVLTCRAGSYFFRASDSINFLVPSEKR